jgi:uncharacterized protein (UPF0335 family)
MNEQIREFIEEAIARIERLVREKKALQLLAKPGGIKKCEWEKMNEHFWHTSCGHNPSDKFSNYVGKYCTFCGRKVKGINLPDKPKCETCGDTHQIGEEESDPITGKSVGWKECPDCQDEAGEFVRINRIWLDEKCFKAPSATRINVAENSLRKSCDIIERLVREKKELEKIISEVRPIAEAYKGVCRSLDIEKDILGYTKDLQSLLSRHKKAVELATLFIKQYTKKDKQLLKNEVLLKLGRILNGESEEQVSDE